MGFFQTTKNGYRYDKRILWGGFLVCVLLMFYISYQFDFDFSKKVYFVCQGRVCENPFIYEHPQYMKYCKDDWCKQETLEMGTYGTPPPDGFLFNNFGWIVFFIMALIVMLNHLIHNRGVEFELLPIEFPEFMRKTINKISEKIEVLDDEDKN